MSDPKTHLPVIGQARLPTRFGDFTARAYADPDEPALHHLALFHGDLEGPEIPLVRMHSECLTGDVLGSLRCDCGPQLAEATRRIASAPAGVLLYLRQEGRGIGLVNKIRAYSLQDQGLDTVEANEHLGFPDDLRDYGFAGKILKDLGLKRLRLLTNNPRKMSALVDQGLEIARREPLIIEPGEENAEYLATKHAKLGHMLKP